MKRLGGWGEGLRRPGAAPIAIGGLWLLFALPGLGSFGLWEPSELRLAEAALALAQGDHAGGGRAGGWLEHAPPVGVWLPALGLRLVGADAGGARVPLVLAGLAALLAVYWAGLGLFGKRASVLAAFVLATTPLFVLGGRQLPSDVPLALGTALALGGLGRFARPLAGPPRLRHLAIGVAGAGLAGLAGGGLSGALAPCLALTVALALAATEGPGDSRRRDGSWTGAALGLLVVGTLLFALFAATRTYPAGQPSWLLGGTPRLAASEHSFEALLRPLAYGLFPWTGLALFALGRPLARREAESGDAGADARRTFAGLFLLLAAAFGLALATVQLHLVGHARLPALPAVALALGAFLDRCLDGREGSGLVGSLAAVGTLLLARDLGLAPADLLTVHLGDPIAWPAALSLAAPVMACALLVALGALGMLALPRAGEPRWLRQAARLGPLLVMAPPIWLAVPLAHRDVPALARHVSLASLFGRIQKLAPPGAVPVRYHVPRTGSGFFDRTETRTVASTAELVDLLRAKPGTFALVPRSELVTLDGALTSAGVAYAVADAPSIRALLLTDRLPEGIADENPLRRLVFHARHPGPSPSRPSRPPWSPPRFPISAVFGEAIELEGADFPTVLRRPARLTLVLHLRVRQPPPPGYSVFVHLELPGEARVHGDHPPTGGVYPTDAWQAGDRIRDEHTFAVPFSTTPPGRYALSVGFWPGGDTDRRLPVTAGEHDGRNRVHLGAIHIK